MLDSKSVIKRSSQPRVCQSACPKHVASIYNTADQFFELGLSILKQVPGAALEIRDRRFRAYFGVTAIVVAKDWKFLYPSLSQVAPPKHLLQINFKIGRYKSGCVSACVLGGTEKNLRCRFLSSKFTILISYVFVSLKEDSSIFSCNKFGFSFL